MQDPARQFFSPMISMVSSLKKKKKKKVKLDPLIDIDILEKGIRRDIHQDIKATNIQIFER